MEEAESTDPSKQFKWAVFRSLTTIFLASVEVVRVLPTSRSSSMLIVISDEELELQRVKKKGMVVSFPHGSARLHALSAQSRCLPGW